MQVFSGHGSPIQCGSFTPDGKRIVTADAEGTLIYWDPRSPAPVFKLTPQSARFNLEGITSIAVNLSSTLAIVGGQSGGVRVVSLSKGEVVSALGGHSEGDSVEATLFIDLAGTATGPGVAITGATDGKAHIWDLSTTRIRATLEHKVCPLTVLWSSEAHLATITGCRHHTRRTPDEQAPSRIGVSGQDPPDVGCPDGRPRTRAQGSSWTHPRCCSWFGRKGGHQRWR
jgi:WD40 repeat protein